MAGLHKPGYVNSRAVVANRIDWRPKTHHGLGLHVPPRTAPVGWLSRAVFFGLQSPKITKRFSRRSLVLALGQHLLLMILSLFKSLGKNRNNDKILKIIQFIRHGRAITK